MKNFISKYFFKSSDSQATQLLKKITLYFIDSEEMDNKEEYKYELNDAMEKELRLCISLLDLETPAAEYFALRSLYYSKLNDSKSALVDAMLAIQTEPRYSDGYLRLADIFLHRKMYKTVKNVYIRALVNIRRMDKNYQLIKKTLDIEQYILTRPVDFVRFLPREIIEEIFSYLPFHMYIVFMAVSRTWYNFMINWSVMWRNLDFNETNTKTVMRCLRHAQGRHIRRLTLGCQTPETLRSIIDNYCQHLEALEFNISELTICWLMEMLQSIGNNLVEFSTNDYTKYYYPYIFDILRLCPELQKLTYKKLDVDFLKSSGNTKKTKVEDLCIQIRQSQSIEDIHTDIFQCFPRLRVLDLEVENICLAPFYESLNRYCPHLETLSLSINGTVHELSSTVDISFPLREFIVVSRKYVIASRPLLLFSSNKLKTLTIIDLTNIKDSLTPSTLSHLRKLNLQSQLNLKRKDAAHIISACTQLEHLVINYEINVTDHLMDRFPTKNQIIAIDVSYCSGIDSVGLTELITSQGPLLKRVNIKRCKSIHKDTVTWAIQQLGNHVVEY
ncbi:unnamed protein product [Rhizopus stolonifer]